MFIILLILTSIALCIGIGFGIFKKYKPSYIFLSSGVWLGVSVLIALLTLNISTISSKVETNKLSNYEIIENEIVFLIDNEEHKIKETELETIISENEETGLFVEYTVNSKINKIIMWGLSDDDFTIGRVYYKTNLV